MALIPSETFLLQRVSEYKQILREYKQTIREYECRQSLAAKTIFELSREGRRLNNELDDTRWRYATNN